MASSSPLVPTFHGYIASTRDALLLFEACLSGALNHVARRPHDRERASLIKSGNVFIYEEHSSGIKRWTDGVPWSPSRILGNFLVYRELERPFPPGEKKRAMKRGRRSPGISKQDIHNGSSSGAGHGYHGAVAASRFESPSFASLSRETERSLIGSLVDSYGFKDDGLVKKTVSVVVGGVSHHLVSYYTVADVMNNKLTTTSNDPRFRNIQPRNDLLTKQNFRTPIDEIDSMDRMDDQSTYTNYSVARSGYDMSSQPLSQSSTPFQAQPLQFTPSSNAYSNYGISAPSQQFDALGSNRTCGVYNVHYVPNPAVYTVPKTEHYDLRETREESYDPAIEVSLNSTRSQVHPVITNPVRRPSAYEQSAAVDSINPPLSADSRFSNDSGYSSQGYYGGVKDYYTPHGYMAQRTYATPSQQPYDRESAYGFNGTNASLARQESFWVLGNGGGAHGQHTSSHPQWANTRTS